MTSQVEGFGQKLMVDYDKVGFDTENIQLAESMPKQVVQYYMEVPTQYRLLYLLMFLYANQTQKIIVFCANCELVNFLESLCKKFDWA